MAEALIEGEPLELIQQAFRGMQAQRGTDGWVSLTGRLDPVPGEALLRALRRAEARLPRQIRSTREEHRAEALDEIARQFSSWIERVPDAGGEAPLPSTAMTSSTEAGPEAHDQRRLGTPANEYQSDPKLRAQTEMILAMPVAERLEQLEAEADFFSSVLPVRD